MVVIHEWERGVTPVLCRRSTISPGQALQLVVQVVGQQVDALVRALDAPAHFAQVGRLLVAQLVQLRADLAQQLLQLLFQRRLALEVVDDLEEDEQDRPGRRRIDQPVGKMRRIRRRNLLPQPGVPGKNEAAR